MLVDHGIEQTDGAAKGCHVAAWLRPLAQEVNQLNR